MSLSRRRSLSPRGAFGLSQNGAEGTLGSRHLGEGGDEEEEPLLPNTLSRKSPTYGRGQWDEPPLLPPSKSGKVVLDIRAASLTSAFEGAVWPLRVGGGDGAAGGINGGAKGQRSSSSDQSLRQLLSQVCLPGLVSQSMLVSLHPNIPTSNLQLQGGSL